MIHIGIDIHKSSSTFCALRDDGKIIRRGKIATSPRGVIGIGKLPGLEQRSV